MTKNEFALKCMEQVNDFIATQGGALIKEANYDANGERMFYHEDGDGDFYLQEMVDWFNIMIHDEDNIYDDCITEKMYQVYEVGYKLGYITSETKKYW